MGVRPLKWPEMTDETPVQNRPTSVTVVSWMLIVMGAISLVGLLFAPQQSPGQRTGRGADRAQLIPIPVQYAMSFGGMLVMIVSRAAMLLGQNWARFLYVVWNGVGFIVGLITSPMKLLMIPGGLIYVVFVLLLFRPRANQFFTLSKVSTPNEVA